MTFLIDLMADEAHNKRKNEAMFSAFSTIVISIFILSIDSHG
jgi:hypothetical protein